MSFRIHVPSSLRAVASLAVFASIAIGCTPSPEKTCDRLQELADKDKSKFSLSRDKCLKRMNEMKERDPDAYKCASKAIAKLDSLDLAFTAISVCDYKKKGKDDDAKDDDDKGGKAGKKSKKSGDEDGFGACVGDAGDKVKKGMPRTFCLEHQSEQDCTKPGAKIDWVWKEGKTCADQGFEKKCTGEWPKTARFETCPDGTEER